MDPKLDTHTLLTAYVNGYFPMPDPQTSEILWFKPDPRAIIPLDGFHVSRSLRRRLKKKEYQISLNKAFSEVMKGCADRKDTWINSDFLKAYQNLHSIGAAHSLEVWEGEQLIGGVYGVSLGGAFFAESKFHRKTDASKIALYHLVEHLKQRGFILLEVQFLIPHLKTLGAIEIPSADYEHRLRRALALPVRF